MTGADFFLELDIATLAEVFPYEPKYAVLAGPLLVLGCR
jgi:hypothetical protein